MKLNIIVAIAPNMGIGFRGKIPWHIKKDLAVFSKLTKMTENSSKKNAVLMGRKTWESIPEKNRPLANRLNIVLSRSPNQSVNDSVIICSSLESALKCLQGIPYCNEIENVWIIGGVSVYKEAMEHPLCHRIYITRVLKDFECDVFMPPVDERKFAPVKLPETTEEENGIPFKFEVLEKV